MGDGTIGLILYMGFFFGLMYFLIIRPQKKKTKQLTELRSSVRVGDEIATIGGIIGRVVKVREDDFTIEVGSAKTKLTFKKWAISTIEKATTNVDDAEEIETIE